jgi:DNA mismatch repair protein MutL
MAKIIQLTENVIAKISAGEVIERPAYAIKELIENSIDAGANVIDIQITDAGLKKIIVKDNGEGMNETDLKLSFLPHTTSKLKDEHDLIGIRTLGFRGEALSSIAAISRLSIRTRKKNQPGGYEVIIRDGEIESYSPVGTPPGTIITVDNLFLNVPARKKFLKSEKTELRLITDIITHFVLSYPSIHFIFTNNDKTILDFSRQQSLLERIRTLLGESDAEQLINISFEEGMIRISGFIGKPQGASKQNQKQFLFINNRHVTDRMIALSVKEAFGTLLPATNTPIFLLNISIPPEIVDVNVHPRKEQVSFINSKEIFDSVKLATTQVLNESNITFNLAKFKYESSARTGETTSYAGSLLRESVLPWNRDEKINFKPSAKLLQIHQTYILSQTVEGLFLIDQHAAHERVLYEDFIQSFADAKKKKEIIELAKPISISLSLKETQLLDEHISYFGNTGFIIDHFQGNNYIIRAVPIVFKGRNSEKIIKDMLADLDEEINKSVDTRTQRMLAFLSCRAAVKSGDVLTEKDMKDLLNKLEKAPNDTTCPHGRPTRITINISEIDQLFKR